MAVLLAGTGCNISHATAPPPADLITTGNGLTLIVETDSLSVLAMQADQQTARDVFTAMQEASEEICTKLQTECDFPVVVEIHPDQASFDKYVINPEMRGFFAISGSPQIIQMVSPANPAPHKISYEEGVAVAVHEFVHLALDKINPDLPTWLDEGTAVYLGPHKAYTTVCQVAFPFEMIPPFQQLEEDYSSVQAPDLFAYTAVAFLDHEYGMEKLNMVLHSPERLENILGTTQQNFEANWQNFMRTEYRNHQSQEEEEPSNVKKNG